MEDIDFENVELDPSKQSVEDIASMVNRMVAKESEISAMEASLAELKEDYRHLSEDEVPTAMDAAGISEFKLTDGRKLKVEDVVRASIAGERMPGAIQWFVEHDLEDLIKGSVKYTFSKGEMEKAKEIIQDILDLHQLQGELKEEVHNATLVVFIKEQIAKGDEGIPIPAQLFGLYTGRQAKFKKK